MVLQKLIILTEIIMEVENHLFVEEVVIQGII